MFFFPFFLWDPLYIPAVNIPPWMEEEYMSINFRKGKKKKKKEKREFVNMILDILHIPHSPASV